MLLRITDEPQNGETENSERNRVSQQHHKGQESYDHNPNIKYRPMQSVPYSTV